jgi:tRNA pseudouridine55 synthase
VSKSSKDLIPSVVLVDKPSGLTSRQCVDQLVKILGESHIGHTGTLDPLATGMLPICIGEATKFARFFLEAEKAYDVTMALGVQTSTGDADGAVIAKQSIPSRTSETLKVVLQQLSGEIQQVVPMVSAVRVGGQRLYKLARLGKIVERPVRKVTIFELSVLAQTIDTITLHVRCSKGTYIRALVEDIAKALGTCAHVQRLHRCWVAPFKGKPMEALSVLNAAAAPHQHRWKDFKSVSSLSEVFDNTPNIHLSAREQQALWHGQIIKVDQTVPVVEWLALYGEDKHFFGVGIPEGQYIKAMRLLRMPEHT